MLGDIHDYDVAIDYLRQHPTSNIPLITSTMANIMKTRKVKFNEFVNYDKSTRKVMVNGHAP
jgi:hypothetical protein